MERHRLNIVLIFFFSIILSLPSIAQMRTHSQRWSKAKKTPFIYRDWMFSLSAGTALYYGNLSNYDLDPLRKIAKESNLSYSVSAGKWIKPYLAVRANFQQGNLHADKGTREINVSFNEYNAQLMINVTDLFDYVSGYQKDFYTYVYLGYGFIDFSSSYYNGTEWAYEGQDKMITEWMIPFGIGIGYNMNQNFTFTFDATLHYINTDKLDAYSGVSKDFLIYLGLGVNYNFNIKEIKGFRVRPKSKRSLKWSKF